MLMKRYLAANWKMFKTAEQAHKTAKDIITNIQAKLQTNDEVIIFPPFTALGSVFKVIQNISQIQLGGQNFYPAEQGAFTGEISPDMLIDAGCTYSIIGHSERRHTFQESNDFVAQKVHMGLEKNLAIILCIGETLDQRQNGLLEKTLNSQLDSVLNNLSPSDIKNRLLIAYEPVWAIGTGKVAQKEDIREAHSLIRSILKKFLEQKSDIIPILYGGSVKSENSSEILSLDNVNGVLVGGASLDAQTFSDIIINSK